MSNNFIEPAGPGNKYDAGKYRHSLIPAGVLLPVIRVLEHGALKYGTENWKRVPDARRRYYDAAMRHLDSWRAGEMRDPETGESHLAHTMCCLMFVLWIDQDLNNGPDSDVWAE